MRDLTLILQAALVLFLVLLVCGCGGSSSSNNNPESPEPSRPILLEMDVIAAPKSVVVDGQWVAVYELVISNQGELALHLEQVTIRQASQTLQDLDNQSMQPLALEPSLVVNPGEFNALFLWVESSDETPPRSLAHEILVRDTQGQVAIDYFELELMTELPASLSPPVSLGPWKASGLHNSSAHRRAFQLFNGQPRFAQRYAVDLFKTDDSGNWFNGDQSDNASYFAYGETVYATASGIVEKVANGFPDTIPGEEKDPATPLAGNSILVKLENGESLLYGHLLVDSILVKEGDQLSIGMPIARIGNSGNSSMPHLHLHVAEVIDIESDSALNGIGRPFSLQSFSRITASGQSQISDEMPLQDDWIMFSEGAQF